MNFHAMAQQENEPIMHYASRLKAQAFLCKFEVECECNPATTVGYADQMVTQRLVWIKQHGPSEENPGRGIHADHIG